MPNTYISNFLKRFYILTQKVRLIWALCAVVLIMFGLDFSPLMGSNVADASVDSAQELTVDPYSNSRVQSQTGSFSETNTASTQLAQAATAKLQGQVKAATAVSIPASKFSGVYLHTAYPFWCPVPGCPTVTLYDPWSPRVGVDGSGNYRTWATFPLSALPPGQTIFSAKLRNFPLSCYSYPGSIQVGPYATFTFYFSSLGTRDPSTDSYVEQWNRSGGSDGWNGAPWRPFGYNGGTCPSLAGIDLGTYAAQDITAAKPLVDRFSFGINGTFVSGGWSYSQPLGTNFILDLTYGIPEVILKVNGTDGPVTVKGGSNITLDWSYGGYDVCQYNASPAWYTEGWPIGKTLGSSTGTASTKIYYENVTYMINCRNTSSGATKTGQVTVNVTP